MNDDPFDVAAIDMAAVVAALDAMGAISLPLLRTGFRERLLEEARRAPFRRARREVGGPDNVVRQDMEVCDTFAPDGAFHVLSRHFHALVTTGLSRVAPYPFATRLDLNDMMIQRYETGSFGITPHRDGHRYVNLVCLFTLCGRARFGLCADRAGHGQHEFDASPGTVILMRAPGFLGSSVQPFHYVEDVREERYSFGLRHMKTATREA